MTAVTGKWEITEAHYWGVGGSVNGYGKRPRLVRFVLTYNGKAIATFDQGSARKMTPAYAQELRDRAFVRAADLSNSARNGKFYLPEGCGV